MTVTAAPPIPLRMLNEFAYCPRLGYLEWVQGEWAENADTTEGEFVHRNVDREERKNVEPDADVEQHARSLRLESEELGLVAIVDVLEVDGLLATPIDYKKGKAPGIPEGAWEPDRIQLCGQALLLRASGFECESGFVYYAASKCRVPVVFDDALIQQTLDTIRRFRETAEAGTIPPPLADSPKCPRCSLVGICLPDETHILKHLEPAAFDPTAEIPIRARPATNAPPNDPALPLYVREQGARIGKDGERLVVEYQGEALAKAKLIDVSQVCIFGNVQITAQALAAIVDRGIPICHFTFGGYFRAITTGLAHKNIELRIQQHQAAACTETSLKLARQFVAGKIMNSRTILRRNRKQETLEALDDPFGNPSGDAPEPTPEQRATDAAIAQLKQFANDASNAPSIPSLLGIEGIAAKLYFSEFPRLLKHGHTFTTRNRRPPTDPVNATLSFLYSLLVKECTVACQAAGLDPMLGFLHQPRYGKPALALDLAEEFRPILADSAAITLLNTRALGNQHFLKRAGACTLTPDGRKALLAGWERRLAEEIAHPIFGYSLCYRRVIAIQARLIARTLTGECPEYPPFKTR